LINLAVAFDMLIQKNGFLAVPKRLKDEFRDVIRTHQYSYLTGETYWGWVRRFIRFHDRQHPRELNTEHIRVFLSYLAVYGKVSAATQNQALSALLFLYKKVLRIDLPWVEDVVRETSAVRSGGIDANECLRLRVQDVDSELLQITVRNGKGAIDRYTILPESELVHVEHQLEFVRSVFESDIREGRNGSICFRPASTRIFVTTRVCVDTMHTRRV